MNFFHDSGKIGGGGGDYGGGGGNGKAFRADLSPDGNVWFFSLTDKNKDKWLVPVSMGEFVVMRQIMQAAIPSFLGIDKALQQISIDDGESSSSFNNNTFGGNSNYNSNSSSNNNNNNMMMSNDDDTRKIMMIQEQEIHLLRVQNNVGVIGWINCKIYYHKKSKRDLLIF